MTVAAQRDVEVVAQPLRQADVPAMPEVPERRREIGRGEIRHEFDAHRARHAARHLAVAGEVEVDLAAEAEHGEDDGPRRGRAGVIEDGIDQAGEHVAQRLAQKAAREQERSGSDAGRRRRGRPQELRQEVLRALDGAGHELRKIGDEGGELDQASRGLDPAAVDVDRVRHGLEDVERDPHREHEAGNLQDGDVEVKRERGIDQEVPVLEEAEDSEVRDDAARHEQLPPPGVVRARDANGQPVVDELRDPQEAQETPVPPPIEDVGEDEQHVDASPPRGRREVDGGEGQEEDQERRRMEEQGLPG